MGADLLAHINKEKTSNRKLRELNEELQETITQQTVSSLRTEQEIACNVANGTAILAPETDSNSNSNENANEVETIEDVARKPSNYIKNQRLIKLTGDQTYMSSHQKVIKGTDQSKANQGYQRKDSFKSIQQENKALKEQIVALNQELANAQKGGNVTDDGVSADYLKAQLSKVREELDEQKKIMTKFNVANECSDGDIKAKYAQTEAELERLRIRYEKS